LTPRGDLVAGDRIRHPSPLFLFLFDFQKPVAEARAVSCPPRPLVVQDTPDHHLFEKLL